MVGEIPLAELYDQFQRIQKCREQYLYWKNDKCHNERKHTMHTHSWNAHNFAFYIRIAPIHNKRPRKQENRSTLTSQALVLEH